MDYKNLKIVFVEKEDKILTNMRILFSDCDSLLSLDASNWNTKNISFINVKTYYL